MPIFSIIVPTYNRANVIGQAIESVLSQKFSDFELIIVDDGSTDNTHDIISAFNDTRIRYFYQENNGVTAARNLGIQNSESEYLTFLDSDDFAMPNWLQDFYELIPHDLRKIIYCDVEIRTASKSVYIKADYPYNNQYSVSGLFLAGAFAIHRSLFNELGLFDHLVKYGEFTEFGFRCNKYGCTSLFTHKKGLIYNQSDTGGAKNWQNRLTSNLYILEKHAEYFKKSPQNKQVYLSVAANAALKLGDVCQSSILFKKAFLVYPYKLKPFLRFLLSVHPAILKRFQKS